MEKPACNVAPSIAESPQHNLKNEQLPNQDSEPRLPSDVQSWPDFDSEVPLLTNKPLIICEMSEKQHNRKQNRI
jgi:hypothetical protein